MLTTYFDFLKFFILHSNCVFLVQFVQLMLCFYCFKLIFRW